MSSNISSDIFPNPENPFDITQMSEEFKNILLSNDKSYKQKLWRDYPFIGKKSNEIQSSIEMIKSVFFCLQNLESDYIEGLETIRTYISNDFFIDSSDAALGLMNNFLNQIKKYHVNYKDNVIEKTIKDIQQFIEASTDKILNHNKEVLKNENTYNDTLNILENKKKEYYNQVNKYEEYFENQKNIEKEKLEKEKKKKKKITKEEEEKEKKLKLEKEKEMKNLKNSAIRAKEEYIYSLNDLNKKMKDFNKKNEDLLDKFEMMHFNYMNNVKVIINNYINKTIEDLEALIDIYKNYSKNNNKLNTMKVIFEIINSNKNQNYTRIDLIKGEDCPLFELKTEAKKTMQFFSVYDPHGVQILTPIQLELEQIADDTSHGKLNYEDKEEYYKYLFKNKDNLSFVIKKWTKERIRLCNLTEHEFETFRRFFLLFLDVMGEDAKERDKNFDSGKEEEIFSLTQYDELFEYLIIMTQTLCPNKRQDKLLQNDPEIKSHFIWKIRQTWISSINHHNVDTAKISHLTKDTVIETSIVMNTIITYKFIFDQFGVGSEMKDELISLFCKKYDVPKEVIQVEVEEEDKNNDSIKNTNSEKKDESITDTKEGDKNEGIIENIDEKNKEN